MRTQKPVVFLFAALLFSLLACSMLGGTGQNRLKPTSEPPTELALSLSPTPIAPAALPPATPAPTNTPLPPATHTPPPTWTPAPPPLLTVQVEPLAQLDSNWAKQVA